MKLTFSRSSATAAAISAASARVFCALMLNGDSPNGAWLSAILGAAIALPMLGLVRFAHASGRGKVIAPVFALLLAVDVASVVDLTAASAAFVEFEHVPPVLLALPLMLVALRATWLGADAVGGAARVWLRLFAVLLAVVVVLQSPYFRFGWIGPLFGPGARSILMSGLRASGLDVMSFGSAMLMCDDESLPGMRKTSIHVLLASVVCAVLILLQLMLAPTPAIANGLEQRLDTLLANGRAALYLQLPMIVMWFTALLNLIAFECVAAAGMIHRTAPKADERVCVAVALILVVMAFAVGGKARVVIANRVIPVIAAVSILFGTSKLIKLRKGVRGKCDRSS